MLLLVASFRGCGIYEFEQEFWLKNDGSGSFTVTAPLWVWNTVKNVGDATNLETTVNEQTVGGLFQDAAILKPRVKRITRKGSPSITVSADFSNINALVGTRAFPDLVIALKAEGDRMRLFGVWRRPLFSRNAPGQAQGLGDAAGLMAVRFHIPSEIFEHRNASLGVERGNILSWRQDLRAGIAGTPLDFGATMGTRSVLRRTLGLFVTAIFAAAASIAAVLFFLKTRGKKRRRGQRPQNGSTPDANFLDYDPGSSK